MPGFFSQRVTKALLLTANVAAFGLAVNEVVSNPETQWKFGLHEVTHLLMLTALCLDSDTIKKLAFYTNLAQVSFILNEGALTKSMDLSDTIDGFLHLGNAYNSMEF